MRLPPVATDKEFVFRRLMLGFLGASLLAFVGVINWAADLLAYVWIFHLSAVTLVVVWLTMQVRSARMLRSCRYAICPTCRYPLQPDSENHTCPECGSTYSNEQLVKIWKRIYDWRLPWWKR